MPERHEAERTSAAAEAREVLRDGNRELSECLVHLLALPALWNAQPAQSILDTLLEALASLLDAELLYAETKPAGGQPRLVAARVSGTAPDHIDIARPLAPCMRDDASSDPVSLPHPAGRGMLRAVCFRMGIERRGLLIAASPRLDFPSANERLLLRLSANQAFVGLEHARLLHEQRRAQEGVRALYESERRARAELQQTLHYAEVFAGVLAHDLRGPLAAILTTAQYLLQCPQAAALQRPLSRIQSSGERMLRLINDLLDFTRIRVGGGLELRPVEANLHDVCRGVLAEVEAAHPDCPLRMRERGDLQGTWDADRIAQVLANLTTNAVQHGVRSAGIEIELDGEQAERMALRVHNQGAIPESALPTLFDPFRSGSEHERKPGLGLGLFITRQIVLAHGGEMRVASSEPAGTTFTVILPRRTARNDAARKFSA